MVVDNPLIRPAMLFSFGWKRGIGGGYPQIPSVGGRKWGSKKL